jgi:hypothetical protein
MLASISPLGERARGQRWFLTVTAYLLGSAAGGAALGLLAGSLGEAVLGRPTGTTVAVAAAICIAAAALDLAGVAPPGVHRQVDEHWLNAYRGWVYGAGYGAQLGGAVLTIVTTWTVHAMVALALLTGSGRAGLAVGLVFGIARALPLLALSGVHERGELRHFHMRFQAVRQPARMASIGALAVVATGALVAGVRV